MNHRSTHWDHFHNHSYIPMLLKAKLIISIQLASLTMPCLSQTDKHVHDAIHDKRKYIINIIESNEIEKINIFEIFSQRYLLTINEQLILLILNGNTEEFLSISKKHQDLILASGSDDRSIELHRSRKYYTDDAWNDGLLDQLKALIISRRDLLIHSLNDLNLIPHEREYIKHYINCIDMRPMYLVETSKQVSLHQKSRQFQSTFPTSPYRPIVQHLHGSFYEIKWFAADVNVGLHGLAHHFEINQNVSTFWSIDIDAKFYRYSTFIGIRGTSRITRFMRTTNIENIPVIAGDIYYLGHFDLYFGRKFDIMERFSLLPFVGTGISQFYFENPRNSGIESIYSIEKLNWNYGFDLNINFRKQIRQKTYTSIKDRIISDNVGYIRISPQMHHTSLSTHSLNDLAFGINVGVGTHLRSKKRLILF